MIEYDDDDYEYEEEKDPICSFLLAGAAILFSLLAAWECLFTPIGFELHFSGLGILLSLITIICWGGFFWSTRNNLRLLKTVMLAFIGGVLFFILVYSSMTFVWIIVWLFFGMIFIGGPIVIIRSLD